MAIIKTDWEKLLAPDSQIPPDVFFLVKGEDKGSESSQPIGAHRIFLAGVSPFFMGMLFGPMKETREVIEVSGTTHEAFNTMIKYIYQPPGSRFFPALHEEEEDGYYEEEEEFNQNAIHCPHKFFDLLDLAEMYQILSLKRDLTSSVLAVLAITGNNVVLAASVAKKYASL